MRYKKKESLVSKRIYFNNSPNPTPKCKDHLSAAQQPASKQASWALTIVVRDHDSYERQHNYCEDQIAFPNEEKAF